MARESDIVDYPVIELMEWAIRRGSPFNWADIPDDLRERCGMLIKSGRIMQVAEYTQWSQETGSYSLRADAFFNYVAYRNYLHSLEQSKKASRFAAISIWVAIGALVVNVIGIGFTLWGVM